MDEKKSKRKVRRWSDLTLQHRRLLKRVVPKLEQKLKDSKAEGKTQEQLSKELGFSRTVISHLRNCMKPTTKNPEFRSVGEIKKLSSRLGSITAPAQLPLNFSNSSQPEPIRKKRSKMSDSELIESLNEMASEVQDRAQQAKSEMDALVDKVQKSLEDWAASKSVRPTRAKNGAKQKTPRVGQVWGSKDKRRASHRSVITAVHRPKDLSRAFVSVRSLESGQHSTSRYEEFVKRFQFMSSKLQEVTTSQ